MITINEILNLSLFKKFNIITGKDYLANSVTTAVILEYESSRIKFEGYAYGYFVLASYFFASTNPDLVNNSIKLLIQKRVSAIAIKMLPDEKLPLELINLANENHVPLLSFYDEFMEDLIININESMKTRSRYIVNEEKLNLIMKEKTDKEEIRRIALEINPDFKSHIICATLIYKIPASNLQIHTFFDRLMYHSSQMGNEFSWAFIKNAHNIILVCSFDQEDTKDLHAITCIKETLHGLGINDNDFYIGYNPGVLELKDIKEAIYKAEIAAQLCIFNKKDSFSYTYAGVYKYIMTIIQNDIMCQEIKNKIKILKEYDELHEANLLKTLISYVKNNGDFAKTSQECFQHTNTIRYRIKKVQELLDLEESTADEELSMIIRSYYLLEM